jgi:1,4-dihydroxy-2-naphthoyl-CoA synthase
MADLLAGVRAADEAREGFRAFREKRVPSWMEKGREDEGSQIP